MEERPFIPALSEVEGCHKSFQIVIPSGPRARLRAEDSEESAVCPQPFQPYQSLAARIPRKSGCLRGFSRCRRQLLHHAESIPVVPALDELAVAQTSNRDAGQ